VTDITTTCDNADGCGWPRHPQGGEHQLRTASAHETKFSYIQPNGTWTASGRPDGHSAVGHHRRHVRRGRNVMSTKDADNNTTRYVYDLANEQTEVEPASGGNQYTYYTLDGKCGTRRTATGTVSSPMGTTP